MTKKQKLTNKQMSERKKFSKNFIRIMWITIFTLLVIDFLIVNLLVK